jgi:hypothetical protein
VRAGAFEGSFVPGEAQLDLIKYVNIQVKQTSGVKKIFIVENHREMSHGPKSLNSLHCHI